LQRTKSQRLFNRSIRYAVRIAQLEARFELVAAKIVKAAQDVALRSFDMLDGLRSISPNVIASSVAANVGQELRAAWPGLKAAIEKLHNRATAASLKIVAPSKPVGKEGPEEDAEDAVVDEFSETLEDLALDVSLLGLISQIQQRSRFSGILINGLTLDEYWDAMVVTQQNRVFSVVMAVLADDQSGGAGNTRTVVRNLTSPQRSAGSQVALLSGQSDSSIVAAVQKHLGSAVHAIGNDALVLASSALPGLTGWVHSAILDEFTCRVCRDADGTFYPVDASGGFSGRSLPIHYLCRCKYLPVTGGEEQAYLAIQPKNFGEWFRDQSWGFQKSVVDPDTWFETFPELRKNGRIISKTTPEIEVL
jgi:hypothetical protein